MSIQSPQNQAALEALAKRVGNLEGTVQDAQDQLSETAIQTMLTAATPTYIPPAPAQAAQSASSSGGSAITFVGVISVVSMTFTATQEAWQYTALPSVLGTSPVIYIQSLLNVVSGGPCTLQVMDGAGNIYSLTEATSGLTELLTQWVPTVGGQLVWRINATGSIGGTVKMQAIGV